MAGQCPSSALLWGQPGFRKAQKSLPGRAESQTTNPTPLWARALPLVPASLFHKGPEPCRRLGTVLDPVPQSLQPGMEPTGRSEVPTETITSLRGEGLARPPI